MNAISNVDPRDAYRDRILRLLVEKLDRDEETREGVSDINLEMKANKDLSKTDVKAINLRAKQDLAAIKRDRKPTDKKAELETVEQVAAALGPFSGTPLAEAALSAARKNHAA